MNEKIYIHKKIIPTPWKVIKNSLFLGDWGGGLKDTILEANYEAKLEFPGGRECKTKKLSMREMWIFSGTTQLF